MPPSSLLRALPLRAGSRRLQSSTRRYASGSHGPQYNEPSGWLFGEKVTAFRLSFRSQLTDTFTAPTPGTEAQARGLGAYMVHWNVRVNGCRRYRVILQARYQVCHGLGFMQNASLNVLNCTASKHGL